MVQNTVVCLTALATGVQVCGIGTTCRSKCCGLLTHGITVPYVDLLWILVELSSVNGLELLVTTLCDPVMF